MNTQQLKQMKCGRRSSSKKFEFVVVSVEAQVAPKELRLVAQNKALWR
jgi:hypothetical protein